ncbi:unnamed protein product [Mucor circinelloides]
MDNNFKLVTLNVGGKLFTTYYDTLKRSSYFQELIQNKKGEQAIAIKSDAQEESFFIDRDGDIFEAIMHYLRSCDILEKTPERLKKLKSEAAFFKFDELVMKVDQAFIIKLNVGGQLFTTFHKTLTQSKYFVNLLSKDSLSGKTMTDKNEIFIDCNGRLFSDVLFYLRTHSVFAKDIDMLRLLQEEAKFYQLDAMVEVSEQEIKNLSENGNQKVPFIVKNADCLKELQGKSNYIVLEEEENHFHVYRVLDVMNVRKNNHCGAHRSSNSCACPREHILKLLLYPTRKQLQ